MSDGRATVIASVITGIFGYIVARMQSRSEIRKLKQQHVVRTVIDKDFAPFIEWLQVVREILSSASTRELLLYQRSPNVMSCVTLLDLRFRRGWEKSVYALDKGIHDHMSSKTRLNDDLQRQFFKLNADVIWFYERQRGCLEAGVLRRTFWRVEGSVRRYFREKAIGCEKGG